MKGVSEEDRKLFLETIESSRPKVLAAPRPRKSAPTPRPGGSGLDGNTQARLRRGALAPDARIDLHGLTEDAAHRALLAFLARAQRQGARLALVITGKGNPRAEEEAAWSMRRYGVLKEMVPRWLNEPDFATLTAGVMSAHARHGGGGALYVYLRKAR